MTIPAARSASAPSLAELHTLRERLSSAKFDQGHLFANWPADPEQYNSQQLHFLTELFNFGQIYEGGVEEYIKTGQRLLNPDQEHHHHNHNDNDNEKVKEDRTMNGEICALEMPPLVFNAPSIDRPSPELDQYEVEGSKLLQRAIFVLVAGGLGERLGYSGIKVGLPVQTATDITYLEFYLHWACQVAGPHVPFVIMTSIDTHHKTQELIAQLKKKPASPLFDLAQMDQIVLLKQEEVFCFCDKAAHLALDASTHELPRKPHGHGDIHGLLYRAMAHHTHDDENEQKEEVQNHKNDIAEKEVAKTKHNAHESKQILLLEKWMQDGYRYICFMQDTNAPAVMTLPVSLAFSERHKLSMNFTCVPRKPKEAVGLLCHVQTAPAKSAKSSCAGTGDDDGDDDDDDNGSHIKPTKWITMNVEYNIFEEIAPRLTKEGGDVADADSPQGFSPYPGNINTLIYNLHDYVQVLKQTKGVVPEFINPKYADETKTRFKKPARIESLMQDFAQLFASDTYRVGAVVFDRNTYQPVKNTLQDGLDKIMHGQSGYCAGTGEGDFYELMRQRCANIGICFSPGCLHFNSESNNNDNNSNNNNKNINTENTTRCVNKALPFDTVRLPIIVLDGSAANHYTLHDLCHVFPSPDKVRISQQSTLLIEGNVIVKSLTLDGVLHLRGPAREPLSLHSSSANHVHNALVIDNVEVHNKPWSIHWLGDNTKNNNTAYKDETDSNDDDDDNNNNNNNAENKGDKMKATRKANKRQHRKITEVDVIRGFVLNKTPAKVITCCNNNT